MEGIFIRVISRITTFFNRLKWGSGRRIDFTVRFIGDTKGLCIEDGVNICPYCVFSLGKNDKIILKEHCIISHGTIFSTIGYSKTLINSHREKEHYGNIIVENGVWIGSNCFIRGGVTIGENSIVGAGSVVTYDIPANCLAYGTPAKFIEKLKIENE